VPESTAINPVLVKLLRPVIADVPLVSMVPALVSVLPVPEKVLVPLNCQSPLASLVKVAS
jgi:hypothetical protein